MRRAELEVKAAATRRAPVAVTADEPVIVQRPDDGGGAGRAAARRREAAAMALSACLATIPIVLALAVAMAVALVVPPPNGRQALIWWAAVFGASALAASVAQRLVRRFLPLRALVRV